MTILQYPSPHPEEGRVTAAVDGLRQAWEDAVSATAPHLGGLREYLDDRLDEAHRNGRLDEGTLIRAIETAMRRTSEHCAVPVARDLDRRLRRALYEFLLAMDVADIDPDPEPLEIPARIPDEEEIRVDERFRRGPDAGTRGADGDAPEPPAPEAAMPAAPPPPPPPPATPPPQPPPQPPPAAPARRPSAVEGGQGWGVRETTPAGNRQVSQLGVDPADVRRKLMDWIGRKRFGDAAALVQRICQEEGNPRLAELAIETGDLCRTRDKPMAATSCYVAALRADPVNESALGRLADLCIDEREVDLAVGHLERMAHLARLRGDERAALGVYRRIVNIAPHRDDILAVLMQAQVEGRPGG